MSERIVFLRGKRVNLRPILRSDIPRWLRWVNDPDVNHFIEVWLPATEAHEERWYERITRADTDDFTLTIETIEGTPIGSMGLHGIRWKDGIARTGAVIGEKEYWDRGLGTEAKMLLLNHVFNVLNLRKVCSSYIEYNVRSGAYQARTGYREEGRLRAQRYRNGRYWDEVLTAVFREEWLPLWEEYRTTHLS